MALQEEQAGPDGGLTGDAPTTRRLAKADVGVTGTPAGEPSRSTQARKLIEIVEVGKQLLITRGSLTTFLNTQHGQVLGSACHVRLHLRLTRGSAAAVGVEHHPPGNAHQHCTRAVIFNALVIPLLVPLSLRGVPGGGRHGASRRDLLVSGLGGAFPFIARRRRPGHPFSS